MLDLTPFRKRLVVARYAKNRFGLGFAGGPAIYMIKDTGNCPLNDEDANFWAHIVAVYNEKCNSDEEEPQ